MEGATEENFLPQMNVKDVKDDHPENSRMGFLFSISVVSVLSSREETSNLAAPAVARTHIVLGVYLDHSVNLHRCSGRYVLPCLFC